MRVEPFGTKDLREVRRLHADVFGRVRLDSFLWQPCQQVESLELEGPKYVARGGAGVSGYAAAYPLDATHFRLNLIVAPSRTGWGVGTRLLSELEAEVRRRGGLYLQARLLEGAGSGLAFALARGFEEIHRMRGMSLRAGDFRHDRWQPLGRRLSEEGFSLTTLKAETEAGRGPVDKLVELHARAQEGWPSPDPTWHTDDAGRRRSLFTDVARPELFSIMKLGERYAGYTSAKRQNLTATAVDPDLRGRGVATYMKAHNLALCIAAGEDYFETCSASPAMIRVNEKLGYRPNGLVEVRLLKRL
jgi:GNAT superfamily N-acetyltransferase